MRVKHIAAAAALAVPLAAQATDGYFSHGYGMKAKGRGGAATAFATDTFGGANNPGSMAFVGTRVDAGLDWFSPQRNASTQGSGGFNFPTPGGPFPLPAGAFDTSVDGNEKSNFFIPEFGYNYMLRPDLALGVTVYGNGGMNTEYSNGALTNPAARQLCAGFQNSAVPNSSYNQLCGNSNLGVDLSQLIIAPTLAWKFHPNHAVGIAPLIGYQRFKAYGLQAFAGISSSPGNLTDQGYDSAWGLGVRFGYFGNITPTVSVGAAYSTKIYMGSFDKYKGLFADQGAFDIPQNLNVGIAWKVVPAVTLALDYQWIDYAGIDAVGNPSTQSPCTFGAPTQPACLGASSQSIGFGWKAVSVWKLGVDWAVNNQWTLRAGYNHTDNPIQPRDVTFNILAPGVVQDHLTLGATYTLPGGSELTAAYMHAFENSVTGDTNPLYFPVGGTQTIKMYQNSFGIAWGMKF
jgi:long-chain fatty acid transport protein